MKKGFVPDGNPEKDIKPGCVLLLLPDKPYDEALLDHPWIGRAETTVCPEEKTLEVTWMDAPDGGISGKYYEMLDPQNVENAKDRKKKKKMGVRVWTQTQHVQSTPGQLYLNLGILVNDGF